MELGMHDEVAENNDLIERNSDSFEEFCIWASVYIESPLNKNRQNEEHSPEWEYAGWLFFPKRASSHLPK